MPDARPGQAPSPGSAQRIRGSCLCGAVEFSVSPPTLFCGHCHCTMCQRNHGAAYVTWFGVPWEQFSLDKGQDELVRHASSNHGTRSFCGRCGSSLFCESTKRSDHVDIVLASMQAPIDRPPQAHVHWDDRAEWTRIGDELPRLGGESGTEPVRQ
jgi:hypothetical protein